MINYVVKKKGTKKGKNKRKEKNLEIDKA